MSDLTDAEREALMTWLCSEWPDDEADVLDVLADVVSGIVAGRVAGE